MFQNKSACLGEIEWNTSIQRTRAGALCVPRQVRQHTAVYRGVPHTRTATAQETMQEGSGNVVHANRYFKAKRKKTHSG
jgi:hypothetical protein